MRDAMKSGSRNLRTVYLDKLTFEFSGPLFDVKIVVDSGTKLSSLFETSRFAISNRPFRLSSGACHQKLRGPEILVAVARRLTYF